jgi:hypothetical protein
MLPGLGGTDRNGFSGERLYKTMGLAFSNPKGDGDIHCFIIEILYDTAPGGRRTERMERNTAWAIKSWEPEL